MLGAASWTFAKKTNSGSTVPQTIAHRGFKAKYPENTMAAFKSAVEVGAHALETDIHLSKDGEVVLSHVSNCATPPSKLCLPKCRIGRNLETLLRRREGHCRLRLVSSFHPSYPRQTSRADAAPARSPRIPRLTRPRRRLAAPRHKSRSLSLPD